MNLAIGLILGLILGQQSQADLSQKVTYRHAAAPVRVILEELSAATKVPLGAAANLNNEILLVSVKDLPLKELLDKIAEAAAGEWTVEGAKTYLTRSSARLKAEDAIEYQNKLAAIQKLLAERKGVSDLLEVDTVERALKRRKQLESQTQQNFDRNAWEQISQIDQGTPGRRALIRIVQSLDPKALAAMVTGDRVVYSTSPNRMQKSMPGNSAALFADLRKDTDVWNQAAARLPASEERSVFVDEDAHRFDKPFVAPPAKALLIVQSADEGIDTATNLSLKLIVTDQEGTILFSSSDTLRSLNFSGMQSAIAEGEKRGAEHKLSLSASAKDLAEQFSYAIGRRSSSGKRPEIGPEWKQRILHPERNEPLSTLASEVVFNIVDAEGGQTVMSLPDLYFLLTVALFAAPDVNVTTVAGALAALNSFGGTSTGVKNGWFAINPARPASMRQQRSNRLAISDYLTQADREGRVTLRNRAAYALKQESPAMIDLGMVSAILLFPEEEEAMGIWQERDWLKLLGTVGSGQLQQLLSRDGRLAVSNMSPQQLGIVQKIIYGAKSGYGPNYGLIVEDENGNSIEAPGLFGPGGRTLRTEPTEALPSGVPRDAYLTITSNTREVVFCSSSSSPGMRSEQELTSLAWNIATRERPDLFPWANQQAQYDRFRLGKTEDFTLTLHLARDLVIRTTLKDPMVTTKGDPLPLESMPEDFQSKLKAAIQKQREQFKNYQPGQFGPGQSPPPPRR